MCSCTDTRRKYWIFGCSVFILMLALVLGLLWPTLAWQIVTTNLVLANHTLNFDNWIETPIPIYLKITMFNWTNSDQLYNPNVKPKFNEMGPYVFLEKRKRDEVVWHSDNNTVSFNQTKTWFFVPEMSNGTLDDCVTNLNVITTTTAYIVRDQNRLIKMLTNYLIREKGGGKAILTKTVRELLFDGYQDSLLDFLKSTNSSTINIPFKKFGWFVERNDSSTYDGRFNMNTGANDISNLGRMNTWNGLFRSPFYTDGCGMINGTTGELWPPLRVPKNPVSLFVTDICRSISLDYSNEITIYDVIGSKWFGNATIFDNGEKFPQNYCFCTGEPASCPDIKSGVMNISDCKFSAPAFVSFPHFYMADKYYLDQVEGLKPIKEKHQFSLTLEPKTGIPLEVNGRLQINMLMQPVDRITVFEKVPKVWVPMFWFEQYVKIDENLAGEAKLALILPSIGVWISYGIAICGLLLLLLGAYFCIRRNRTTHEQFQNEESDENKYD